MQRNYEAINHRKLLRLKAWQQEAGQLTGTVRDMDTVLADIMENAEDPTGTGEELIDLYLNCTDKQTFQALFAALTGETWGRYLTRAEQVLAEILHKE